MRPKEHRESGNRICSGRVFTIIDMDHALVKLSGSIDWRFLEQRLGAVYTDKPGHPPCRRGSWPASPSLSICTICRMKRCASVGWRTPTCSTSAARSSSSTALCSTVLADALAPAHGGEKLLALLQESLAVATRTEAMKPSDLARVVIDTTVQPKAVMFPTDAKLINRARERLVRLAHRWGVDLRQSYRRVGKLALIKHQRYAHAHQFKRANKALRKLKTYLGRVIRDIGRRIAGNDALEQIFAREMC